MSRDRFSTPAAHALEIVQLLPDLNEAIWFAAVSSQAAETYDELLHWAAVMGILSAKAELWN